MLDVKEVSGYSFESMDYEAENVLKSKDYSLPLRREVAAAAHILSSQASKLKTGLDVGFTNPAVSVHFRSLGGYWMTVEPSPSRQRVVSDVLGESTVLCAGADGELPFGDRQFDALVLAHGMLTRGDCDAIVQECHRVLKTGGLFVMTVAHKKRFGLARLLSRSKHADGEGGWFDEKEIFNLLRDGFDVLGFHYSCRFWVQMVRLWADSRNKEGKRRGAANVWLRFLYGVAWVLDMPLFFARGYQMTVCGRRKGWRGQTSRVLSRNTPVSDAMLFDTKRGSSKASWDKFR